MKKKVCLDLGGSKCGQGLMLGDNLNKGDDFFPTGLDDFTRLIDAIIKDYGGVDGLAMATAGVIRDNKIVVVSPNIPWLSSVDLAKWAGDSFQLPCVVTNDLVAAIMGEKENGVLADCENAAMDTISTGWGGALIVNGVVIPGEPGHIKAATTLKWGNARCDCGKWNCNEAHFSGGAVAKFLRGSFAGREASFGGLDPCALLDQRAAAGIPWATNLYVNVAEGIAEAWAGLLNRFSTCEKIVYMGTFAMRGMQFMLPTIRRVMLSRVMFERHKAALEMEIANGGEPRLIYPSILWPSGALYGAAAVYEEVLGEHHTI